jgi:hypothetical protein
MGSFLNFVRNLQVTSRQLWVPCHHGKARPQVADGGNGLQIWRVKGKGKVVPLLNLIKHYAMKAYGGVDV